MELDKKVDKLSEEIATMKDEFSKAQAELREMLGAMGAAVKGGTPPAGPQPSDDVDEPSVEPTNEVSLEEEPDDSGHDDQTGGLSLSHTELELMVEEARAGAQSSGSLGSASGDALMSIDRLARQFGRQA